MSYVAQYVGDCAQAVPAKSAAERTRGNKDVGRGLKLFTVNSAALAFSLTRHPYPPVNDIPRLPR